MGPRNEEPESRPIDEGDAPRKRSAGCDVFQFELLAACPIEQSFYHCPLDRPRIRLRASSIKREMKRQDPPFWGSSERVTQARAERAKVHINGLPSGTNFRGLSGGKIGRSLGACRAVAQTRQLSR